MKWTDHVQVDDRCERTSQRIGFILRVKHLLPIDATLYMCLISPVFHYGDVIWGDKNNETLMSQLQVLQNRATKVILDKPYYSSASEVLHLLNAQPLDERRWCHRVTVIYKMLHDEVNYDANLKLNHIIHSCNTRSKKQYNSSF